MTATALESTVQSLLASGKGILAADESFPTIKKRFRALNILPTAEIRISSIGIALSCQLDMARCCFTVCCTRRQVHTLTPFAKVRGTTITYPAANQRSSQKKSLPKRLAHFAVQWVEAQV